MSFRPRCLAVGLALIDYCYSVDSLPSTAGKHFASAMRSVLGGVATNAALTLSTLGADTRLLSRLGADASGDWILASLKQSGIDTTFIKQVPGRVSASSAVCIDKNGERSIVNYRDRELFAGKVDIADDVLVGVDGVICDTRWHNAARAILSRTRESATISVLDYDQNPDPDSASLIELADYTIFAKPALLALSACSDARSAVAWAAQKYPGTRVAVTCGAEGVLFWADGAVSSIPAHKLRAVNTLGAGDVFHGACCYALACGRDFEDALHWGNAAAAMRVSGAVDFPSLEQVDSLYNRSNSPHTL